MKLLAYVIVGIFFGAGWAQADDALVKKLHEQMNVCDADAAQTGVPMHEECSEVQVKLSSLYPSYAEYQAARKAYQ